MGRSVGSASVKVGNVDRVYCMEWTVELMLRPKSTVLEQHVTLSNRSDVRHRFLLVEQCWSCGVGGFADRVTCAGWKEEGKCQSNDRDARGRRTQHPPSLGRLSLKGIRTKAWYRLPSFSFSGLRGVGE